jgi:hypothetical protein
MKEINQDELLENQDVSGTLTRANAAALLESAEPAPWLFTPNEDGNQGQTDNFTGLSAEMMNKFSTILMTEF